MHMSPAQFRAMPLFHGISDDHLAQLADIFHRLELDAGSVVFESNSPAEYVYLLERGEIEVREGDKVRFRLHPPTPIGELGGLTGTRRITTAVTTQPSVLLRVTREALMRFFENHGEVAVPFYQNLITLVTHKVRRDQRRLADMRENLISTQKAMKVMRNYLLESQDTPVSETLHNTLDQLIRRNRRVNYRVSPPEMFGSQMRLDSGRSVPVVEISRTHASFVLENGDMPQQDATFSGVLCLSGPEIPVSGSVVRTIGRRVDLQFDLLIDEYSSMLDDYLTHVQLLDYVV